MRGSKTERIAGFQGRTLVSRKNIFPLSSCPASVLHTKHIIRLTSGLFQQGDDTDSQRWLLTFSIPSCPLFTPGRDHLKSDGVRHVETQLPFYKGLFVSCEICQNHSKILDAFPKRAGGPAYRSLTLEEDVKTIKEMSNSKRCLTKGLSTQR